MKTFLRIALVAVAAALITVDARADNLAWVRTTVIPKTLAYSLSVVNPPSAIVIEFEPLSVQFELAVTITGIGGDAPAPVDVDVCPALVRPETTCFHIAKAQPGRKYAGTVTAMAPPAGKTSPLRLVVLSHQDPRTVRGHALATRLLTEGSSPVTSAARYFVSLDGFDVQTTRSNQTDTIWVTMQGLVKATPPHPSEADSACKLAGFTWCFFAKRVGDAGDGYHAISDFRVGPYNLVPEAESDLRFLFQLDNIGEDFRGSIAAGVADAFSKVGMLVLEAYGAESKNGQDAGFAKDLDSVIEQMHSSATASCDGTVANDIIVITNKVIAEQPQTTLEQLTRSSGKFEVTAPRTYTSKDGDFVCDHRGSHYTVTYSIVRDSWRAWGWTASF